jgi:hypothetical protein
MFSSFQVDYFTTCEGDSVGISFNHQVYLHQRNLLDRLNLLIRFLHHYLKAFGVLESEHQQHWNNLF